MGKNSPCWKRTSKRGKTSIARRKKQRLGGSDISLKENGSEGKGVAKKV